MKEPLLQEGDIYRHYKGQDYRVKGVVRHSETLEELVLYDCLYENKMSQTWVRPIENFTGYVEQEGKKIKRFEKQNQ